MLDREIEPALAAVLHKEASDVSDLKLQFQFVVDLLREEAEDKACVLRQAHNFKLLLDRYFGNEETSRPFRVEFPEARRPVVSPRVMEDGLINEAILDSLPDRVAVITTDYRYLYSNPLNAGSFSEKPIDLVGRHIVEFIGMQRFDGRVKRHLDRCFAGEIVEYDYISPRRGSTVTRCRMTPCLSAVGNVLGAILVLQDVLEARGPIAA
ncbi:PAS domain-containing protein [Shinella curvata]|uniref:PAS domain-containing protein n=1 Tax=Shinella curvata TaxID=1817964 RepID=A0ABT8X8S6_9HYPH|nr:PAS domain-containing protein [Shinella curvata]MCJ8052198.1 PAS domain-containing protein [Shinella curvata]MDO6119854.1 PAS domain-containing protein [Shinella curvata]